MAKKIGVTETSFLPANMMEYGNAFSAASIPILLCRVENGMIRLDGSQTRFSYQASVEASIMGHTLFYPGNHKNGKHIVINFYIFKGVLSWQYLKRYKKLSLKNL